MTTRSIKIVDIPSSNTIEFDTKMLVVDPASQVTRLMPVGVVVDYLSELAQNTANLAIFIANTANSEVANLANLVYQIYDFANVTSNTLNIVYNTTNTIFDTTNSVYILANNTSNKLNIVYDTANVIYSTSNTVYENTNTIYSFANTVSNVANYANNTANYANNAINNLPYGIIGYYPGTPTSNAMTTLYIAAWDITFAENMGESRATAVTTATSNTDFSIVKNGLQVATLRYKAGNSTGIFLQSSEFTLQPNDILQVFAPATPDTTLADIAYTLVGVR